MSSLPIKLAPAARNGDSESYKRFARAPSRADPTAQPDLRPLSPIRRSGSPLRRKQIQDLEKTEKQEAVPAGKKQKTEKAVRFPDAPQADLQQMAGALEKISSAFAETAASVADAGVLQKQTLNDLAELKQMVLALQKDVAYLVKRAEDSLRNLAIGK